MISDSDLVSVGIQAGLSNVCLAFVNSDSGEATNNVDGNFGDRNNLTVSSIKTDLITSFGMEERRSLLLSPQNVPIPLLSFTLSGLS